MIRALSIGTVNPLVAPLHAALHGAARRVPPPFGSWDYEPLISRWSAFGRPADLEIGGPKYQRHKSNLFEIRRRMTSYDRQVWKPALRGLPQNLNKKSQILNHKRLALLQGMINIA